MVVHMLNESLVQPICWGSSMRNEGVVMHRDIDQVTCVHCLRILAKKKA